MFTAGHRTNKDTNRVEIHVFRGANDEANNFAPWGYVVRQPIDGAIHDFR